jgi:hypothetical protein
LDKNQVCISSLWFHNQYILETYNVWFKGSGHPIKIWVITWIRLPFLTWHWIPLSSSRIIVFFPEITFDRQFHDYFLNTSHSPVFSWQA